MNRGLVNRGSAVRVRAFATLLALLTAMTMTAPAETRVFGGPRAARPATAAASESAPGDAIEAARAAGLFVGVQVADPQAAAIAGQRAVNGGTRAGTGAACFNCHGMQGQGDVAGGFPRIGGMSAFYIAKQLADYANGTRPNEVMTPIAVQLTEEERRDLGVYYATLQPSPRRAPQADARKVQHGATLAAVGSPQQHVQACSNCHGPNGIGMPPDVPYLAGQNARYLELQLQSWRQGRRTNDLLGVMRDIANRLSADDAAAVAQYFASLPASSGREPPAPTSTVQRSK